MSGPPVTTGPETARAAPRRNDVAGWMVVGVIGVAVLFLGYVHAPQRLKLPLLAPLGLGALAGWGLGQWGLARQINSRTLIIVASSLLIAAGQIGAAWETYRLGSKPMRAELERRQFDEAPLAERIEQALEETAEDEETRADLQATRERARQRREEEFARRQRLQTFAGYLDHRIPRAWGPWKPPWPQVFWGLEVLLACGLGGWLAGQSLRAGAMGGNAAESAAMNRSPSVP